MTAIKARALDAAIELLGTEGLRALTHARVDDRAALPRGSTSNHFRTRAALLSGVVEWIVQKELPAVGAMAEPKNTDQFVDEMVAMIDYTTGPNRTLTAARLTVFGEAVHNAEISAAVSRGRAGLELALTGALARLGARDPLTAARALMACAEGIILHRMARHDDADARPVIDVVVRGALA
ncbi:MULTISPECIES: TetR family transcriptional regulator [unclassified Diaminobutyricimonas]|uniref:TetR/AcrR family transcriptional regulator n=1 Tax=unclassified Diaminobutyricimonas TaxID=2643261 RepID=UPI0012F48FC5|nr:MULTISPECIES: TetR family transcriptional regulator [unclassified Diaminobutyricimonas]